jgi:hypothetical protein
LKRSFAAFLLVLLCVMAVSLPAGAAPLSRKKATAIVLYDQNETSGIKSVSVWSYFSGASYTRAKGSVKGAALAAETIRGALARSGYNVLGDSVTRRILKARIKENSQPDSSEVRQLSKAYKIGQYIDGTVSLLDAEKNSFGMYTGSAVVTVNAYDSTGRTLYSDSVIAKGVGITEDESQIKAVQKAASQIAGRITGGDTPDGNPGSIYVSVSGASGYRNVQSVVTACRTVYGVSSVKTMEYKNGTALIAVYGSCKPEELKNAITDKVEYSTVREVRDGTIYIDLH